MTANRYTLPAELGGGEVEAFTAPQFSPLPDGYSWMVTVEGRVVFPAPVWLLTPVKPPQEEPPDLAWVQVDAYAWRRVDGYRPNAVDALDERQGQ